MNGRRWQRRCGWRRRFVAALASLLVLVTSHAANYYVDPVRGDDSADGSTAEHPWRTLARANQAQLRAGDRLALLGNERHAGQLFFEHLAGTADSPITITSYLRAESAATSPALIDGRGETAALRLRNCRYVTVQNLVLTADGGRAAAKSPAPPELRCGALIEADESGEFAGIILEYLHVRGVSFEDAGFARPEKDVKTENGAGRYGWGIRFLARSRATVLRDLVVRDCRIERVDHTGLKFTGPSGAIRGVRAERVTVSDVGGPGIQMSGVVGGRFSQLHVDHSGSTGDARNWGRGSGLWTWDSSDVVIERSEFTNAHGPGDSAGVHIDFHCRDVIVQHNFSANNAGGFCEILGDNHNCAYRYNVSVNDGYRVKGREGAFQEGKIFWLSGYVGRDKRTGPFNTYFYNNTIYVGPEIEAKLAVAPTTEGVLIANNIFYFAGRSRMVAGDQSLADQPAGVAIKRVVFANNLFLRADNWPDGLGLRDGSPRLGDPEFEQPGGGALADYQPRNISLVKGRGIAIEALPGDPVGLRVGLGVTDDILGRAINQVPDLGAIAVP